MARSHVSAKGDVALVARDSCHGQLPLMIYSALMI